MQTREYPITPVAKPRMTGRDVWLDPPRPPVSKYRQFCLECKLERLILPCYGAHVTFVIPMPEGWSKKKKIEFDGKPHMGSTGKPPTKDLDLDNLLKALGDAIYKNDSGIYDIHITKRWGSKGKIIVEVE